MCLNLAAARLRAELPSGGDLGEWRGISARGGQGGQGRLERLPRPPQATWPAGRRADRLRRLHRPGRERRRVLSRGALAALHGTLLSQRVQPRAGLSRVAELSPYVV